MTSTALISEKERLYHFYVTCNMSKEETCRAMGYYCVRGKNKGKPSRWFLEESIRKYNIKKPKFLNTFNLQKSIYLMYGVNSMTKLPEIQAKKRATCLKKYGTEDYMQTKEYKEKSKQTCLKKYGVENAMQAEETRNKIKTTCLERYGFEYYTKTDECKEKIKNTNLKKYGVENCLQSLEVQNKSKATNLEKYGAENIFASDYGKIKIKETMQKRYRIENPGQSEKFMEKARQTKKERYGNKNYNNREKTKQTCLKKYGVENVAQVSEIKAKKKATCLEKYGFESIFQSKERMEKIHEIQKINGSLRTSKPENDIYKLLLLKFPKAIHHLKDKEKYPFYCDFYVPEIDTWIEYQGTVEHGNYKGEILGPYNADNLKHQAVVKELQEKSINHPRYETILKVWTISDPLKRKTAYENGLNWLEFFNMKEFMNWYNSI